MPRSGPDISQLWAEGLALGSPNQFRWFHRLLDTAVAELPARLSELTDTELVQVLTNLSRAVDWLETQIVPRGWAKRKRLRLVVDGVIVAGGIAGLIVSPGLLPLAVTAGSAGLFSWDIASLGWKATIQGHVLRAQENIETVRVLVGRERTRRKR